MEPTTVGDPSYSQAARTRRADGSTSEAHMAPHDEADRHGLPDGRSPSGRRTRLVTRPLLTAAVASGVVAAFLVGTTMGGDDSSTPPGAEPPPSPAAFQADLVAAESCEELLAAYVDRALPLVGAWGWEQVIPLDASVDGSLLESGRADGTAERGVAAPTTQRQTSSDTGTNVQEAGVDEPDTVKTDGDLLARVRDDRLEVYDVRGEQVTRAGSLRLPGIEDAELLLSGDTVVAIGTDDTTPEDRGSRVLTVSLTDPAAPVVVDDVRYDATTMSARQHGDVVRLVLSSGLPELDFVTPDHQGSRGHRQALEHNRDAVRSSTIEDWLPTLTTRSGTEQLLDCTDVAVPDDELGLDTVSIVGFTAGAPSTVEAIGLAGATDIAYESADHLYLAASPRDWWGWGCVDCSVRQPDTPTRPVVGTGTSYLIDLALDGTTATHVASGEVEGSIADRWSLDESGGVLRVAVGPTSETGSFNSVVTMTREGEELRELGRLDGLGRNEDITSVRWFDDLAILVTFRRIDPLYSVDLTDDADPRLLGELKIPGFSSYLHPLGSQRLVGIGEGPTGRGWGAQAGLFDVTDLTDVRRLDVETFHAGTRPVAGDDPRAFTWLPDRRTVLTVIDGHRDGSRVGWVSVLRVEDGALHRRMEQVEYGSDVEQVRTVPLPDGRVVLVTGEDARFFPV